MSDSMVIALRGALHQAPENTLPAINKALSQGVDGITLDVQGSKDELPVVIADTKLDRTTNGRGKVNQMTAKEIQKLDAGSWVGAEYQGTKVPMLEDAVKEIGDRARLFVTLPDVRAGSALSKNIAKALEGRQKPEEDVLVFSDSESLKVIRELAPRFQCALALDEKVEGWVVLRKAEKLGLTVVRPHFSQVTSEFVSNARKKGIKVIVHFANEEDDMEFLLDLKVDGIITGRIERLKGVMAEAKA